MEFGPWRRLDHDGLRDAPDEPAAVQVRREEGLVRYPEGKSAMLFYFHAQASVRGALESAFADELEAPGARGQGPVLFRWVQGEGAADYLAELLGEFERRFGAPPLWHQGPSS